jgi:hypothetical protein
MYCIEPLKCIMHKYAPLYQTRIKLEWRRVLEHPSALIKVKLRDGSLGPEWLPFK